MSRWPPDWYVLRRFVVDDTTIADDDPQAIIDPVWYSADAASLEAWEKSLRFFSRPQRLAYAMLWTSADVCNGGLDQFFWDGGMILLPEAVEGFDAIGRSDIADILREAAACFPATPNREIGPLSMKEMPQALDELTRRYYREEGDFFGPLLAYIRSQPAAFYFDGEIHAPPPLPPEERVH